MVTITSFNVKGRVTFKSHHKTWLFVPFLIISRVTDAATDEYIRNAQNREPDRATTRDSSGNTQH